MVIAFLLMIGGWWFFAANLGRADRAERDSIDPKWIDDPAIYTAWLQGKLNGFVNEEVAPILTVVVSGDQA